MLRGKVDGRAGGYDVAGEGECFGKEGGKGEKSELERVWDEGWEREKEAGAASLPRTLKVTEGDGRRRSRPQTEN